MKKSVKITTIVICSIFIVLTTIGFVFSMIDVANYSKIIDAHSDDAWFNTEEGTHYESLRSAGNMQIGCAIAVFLCVSSLLMSVLFRRYINDAINDPNFYLGLILKKTIKIHFPFEIIGITTGVVLYLVFQFITIAENITWLFAIIILLLNIIGIVLFMTIANTVITQRHSTKDISTYQRARK